MKRFELCFSIDSQTVLIPDLLPIDEPLFEFDYKEALRHQIEYEFLPRAVLPRVIVSLHTDTKRGLR